VNDPIITKPAVLIDNVGASDPVAIGTGGLGRGANILQQVSVGAHSIIEIAGVFYVVILTDAFEFQVYRSTDEGATWATYGSALSPTVYSGGMETLVDGATIHLFYSKGLQPPLSLSDPRVFLCSFDTAGGTWGSEDSYDLGDTPLGGVDFRVEGPYAAIRRLDGSIVLPVNDLLSGYPCFVTYNAGTWAGPFVLKTTPFVFETWTIRPDGTVDLFYAWQAGQVIGVSPWSVIHVTLDTDDTFADVTMFSGLALAFSPVAWADNGLGWGYELAGDFFLACGAEDPVEGPEATGGAAGSIWGRAAIAYGNDGGGWTVGQRLDTDAAVDDYSMLSCSLHRFGDDGLLVYIWRGINRDRDGWIERVGWAPEGSHDTPADWTFVTAYDFTTPDPAVSGQTAPYQPPPNSRDAYAEGVTLSPLGDHLRVVTSLRGDDDEIFAAYLLDIEVPTFGNEFFFGGAYFGSS
jgi:hypothetical protein